ncbi:hypothetical protein K491DRAFT_413836 [Lophiostoma macrostomum CBS 122681]|uniref:Uncharacterized protein n=1 Tax=Lophiostoma macrostomum CBS 122681 TaxID=1314788 RepID=A0A6A6T8M0_9PLEO|nr:hypothetical protein K491DRAFT_413836 [Lophiostoma macrostomum CBS 122681]
MRRPSVVQRCGSSRCLCTVASQPVRVLEGIAGVVGRLPGPRKRAVPVEGFILGTRISAAIAGRRRCSTTIIPAETAAGSTGKLTGGGGRRGAARRRGDAVGQRASTARPPRPRLLPIAARPARQPRAERTQRTARPAQRAASCDAMMRCAARDAMREAMPMRPDGTRGEAKRAAGGRSDDRFCGSILPYLWCAHSAAGRGVANFCVGLALIVCDYHQLVVLLHAADDRLVRRGAAWQNHHHSALRPDSRETWPTRAGMCCRWPMFDRPGRQRYDYLSARIRHGERTPAANHGLFPTSSASPQNCPPPSGPHTEPVSVSCQERRGKGYHPLSTVVLIVAGAQHSRR